MTPVHIFQPGEDYGVQVDLSTQPLATGVSGVLTAQTVSSATASKTLTSGAETTPLAIGTVTVGGTGVKENLVVTVPLTGGTDDTDVKITVQATWSNGDIIDYEFLVLVRELGD